jgi:hypothetical protein
MKNILLFCVILLSACASNPVAVKQEFPEVPKELMEKCPDLDIIDKPTVLLSELIVVITKNYMKYHDCRNEVENWQYWYNKQKKISDNINK